MSERDLDHDEGVARIDGNYLALRYISEVRKWRAIAERDHGAPVETVERLKRGDP